MSNGQKAGLAHFNGGKTYAFIAVVKQENELRLEFEINEQSVGGEVFSYGQDCIYLRTSMGVEDKATFQYSWDGMTFYNLGGIYPMTSANFRGDMIGVFTYNDLEESGFVDVDWFHYLVTNK